MGGLLQLDVNLKPKKPLRNQDFALAGPGIILNPLSDMQRFLPFLLIIGILILFRAVGSAFPNSLPNFQPLAAVFFCGALLAPGWRGFAIPLAVWAVTYPLGVGPVSDPAIFLTTLLGFTLVFLLGKNLSHKGFPTLLAGSAMAALVFHLVTNTLAWLGDPLYAKNLAGLWQSLWSGPLASPVPSWVFLRNMAAANVLFTAIFALAQLRLPQFPATAPVLAK